MSLRIRPPPDMLRQCKAPGTHLRLNPKDDHTNATRSHVGACRLAWHDDEREPCCTVEGGGGTTSGSDPRGPSATPAAPLLRLARDRAGSPP